MPRTCHADRFGTFEGSRDSSAGPEKVSVVDPAPPRGGKTVVTLMKKPLFSCFRAYLSLRPSVNSFFHHFVTRTQRGSIQPRGRLKPHGLATSCRDMRPSLPPMEKAYYPQGTSPHPWGSHEGAGPRHRPRLPAQRRAAHRKGSPLPTNLQRGDETRLPRSRLTARATLRYVKEPSQKEIGKRGADNFGREGIP